MSPVVIRFDPAGTGHCLYTELLDLTALGALDIRRASHIEFNQETQQWEVRNTEDFLLYSHSSRAACLAWEHQYFNR